MRPSHRRWRRLRPPRLLLRMRFPERRRCGMDVLLVEDEPSVRALVAEMLRDAGLIVTTTESAEAALDAVLTAGETPMVVVTNVALGRDRMGGAEFGAAVRRRWPEIGVV